MKRLAVILSVAFALAGCGGSASSTSPPKLPRGLAERWAQRADAIAAAVASGDGCTAQRLANNLRTDVIGAEGRVAARYRPILLAAVTNLADGIACAPPAPAIPFGPPGHGKPNHGDHGNQGGEGD